MFIMGYKECQGLKKLVIRRIITQVILQINVLSRTFQNKMKISMQQLQNSLTI